MDCDFPIWKNMQNLIRNSLFMRNRTTGSRIFFQRHCRFGCKQTRCDPFIPKHLQGREWGTCISPICILLNNKRPTSTRI